MVNQVIKDTTGKTPSSATTIPNVDNSTRTTTTTTDSGSAMVRPSPKLLCGLCSGILQTVVFNPFDRALFLAVRDHTPFLSKQNFLTPFQGLSQAILVRALSAGLYFPLEHYFLDLLGRDRNRSHFLAGSGAGVFSSAILNPLTALKYQTWLVIDSYCQRLCFFSEQRHVDSFCFDKHTYFGLASICVVLFVSYAICINRGREDSGRLIQEAKRMWRRGGITPFMFGMKSRLLRDITFGALYTGLRKSGGAEKRSKFHQFLTNGACAIVATLASGPFNFVQNVQYATSSKDAQPKTFDVLKRFYRHARRERGVKRKFNYMQERLRWGTCLSSISPAFLSARLEYVIPLVARLGNNSSSSGDGSWQFCL